MQPDNDIARSCIRFGWTALAVFAVLGLALETLHLFKVAPYMEVSIRRELWTLAHAHGVLLALVTVVFGIYVEGRNPSKSLSRASAALRSGALLVPLGFFAGGHW